ncbi:MAG: ArsA-related P-loop ATPase [Candidatus Alcyoniella australis]|nr:ArsA-related P-loop ATPase [Candidatus Alcyoniella australis]
MSGLGELIRERGVLVCVGPGGVGKTTVSAALAIAAAAQGRRTIVCTIDPARRLANALGLSELGNEESRIPEQPLRLAGIEPQAELYGMMLDTKQTFDELVQRLAPSEQAAQTIMENVYYQNLSDSFAGSQEYIALEKLYALYNRGEYDLIVLDTPPTKHALDFLEAPRRMIDFLDGSVIQWFVKPYVFAGKIGFRFARRSARLMFSMLEKISGFDVLADLTDFFIAFEGLWDGFRERAECVESLLRQPQTAFVLVTSPTELALSEAQFFAEKLIEFEMDLGAVIFNRVHPDLLARADLAGPFELRRALRGPSKLAKWIENKDEQGQLVYGLGKRLADLSDLGRMDLAAIEHFLQDFPAQISSLAVQQFQRDVHDIDGLARIAKILVQGADRDEK